MHESVIVLSECMKFEQSVLFMDICILGCHVITSSRKMLLHALMCI